MNCDIHDIPMLAWDDENFPVRVWICPACITRSSWTKELRKKVGYKEGMENGGLSDSR